MHAGGVKEGLEEEGVQNEEKIEFWVVREDRRSLGSKSMLPVFGCGLCVITILRIRYPPLPGRRVGGRIGVRVECWWSLEAEGDEGRKKR